MIEQATCYWCNYDATHATNGAGDGLYPSCNACCEGCDELNCGYIEPKQTKARASRNERITIALANGLAKEFGR